MNGQIDFAILDSGTGGIPYMIDIKQKRPDCSCVYLGDTAHFPYGQKTHDEVVENASLAVQKIISLWNPKCIVVACNTISVTALDELRKNFAPLPFIGTVPAIKLAARITRNKRIGLLATNLTVNHPYTNKLIEDFACDCKVIKLGDPDLVDFIEHKYFVSDENERFEAIRKDIDFFKSKDVDTIILGCTHFTHIASEFTSMCGKDIIVIDSRDGVSNQAIKVRFEKSQEDNKNSPAVLPCEDMSFFVTSLETQKNEDEYKSLCSSFNIPWGGKV